MQGRHFCRPADSQKAVPTGYLRLQKRHFVIDFTLKELVSMSTLQTDFQTETFQPPAYLRNAHIQTLLAKYLRPESGVDFRRTRLDTPDGDFIDLDFADVSGSAWSQMPDDAPILLLLHGLEGCARSGYAYATYRLAARAGLRPVGMNYRSCSGEMNRTARFYHMGATDDVQLVVRWLREQFGAEVPLLLIGFSLGGNMLLKYLGEGGATRRESVTAAASISPPFVATGEQRITCGTGALYGLYLLHKLKRKVRLKASDLKDTPADIHRALAARTLRDFDEAITAPLHGFRDADDYYATSNSVRFLADIQVPTLVIRAQDDPFFNNDIPHDRFAENDFLTGVFPAHGGHVGFIEANQPVEQREWALRQAVTFLQSHVTQRENQSTT